MEARRTGQTTRIIDESIQTLFREGKVQCLDHHNGTKGLQQRLSDHIGTRIMERLSREHPNVIFTAYKDEHGLTVVALRKPTKTHKQ